MRATALLLPALLLIPATGAALEVSAKSAIIIEEKTGKVLWEKDADTKRYPASTTKIMTSLLLLEHCLPTDVITAPADIEKIKESSMNLKPFEQVTAKDMLYAVMLRSANDGSHAVATHIAGSVPAFSKMMNERAKRIGATNTTFNNPHGLNDDKHMTTARDLALIAREAMKYEPFREVARTQRKAISRSINFKDMQMVSRNKWLAKDVTADGIKTGYTRPAGYCYVGSATRDGFRVITVILKSDNWQKDHENMLNWSYKYFEKKDEVRQGEPIGHVAVEGGTEPVVAISAVGEAISIARKAGTVERVIDAKPVAAPIQKGQKIGELVLRDSDGFEQRIPLQADADVPMSPLVALKTTASSNGWGVVLGSVLFVGAYFVRSRARRFTHAPTTKEATN